MITVHRRLSTQWVKPNEEDDAEFLIRPLNSAEMVDVENELRLNDDGAILISGKGLLAACRGAIQDWKGVKDENGKDLPFAPKYIEWLPPDTLQLLTVRIYSASQLTDEERKNS